MLPTRVRLDARHAESVYRAEAAYFAARSKAVGR